VLLQRRQSSVLKGFHGTFSLAEDAGDLCVCEAEEELERKHLALLG
jgi:hypothetical protein